jgi:hypothetical protein
LVLAAAVVAVATDAAGAAAVVPVPAVAAGARAGDASVGRPLRVVGLKTGGGGGSTAGSAEGGAANAGVAVAGAEARGKAESAQKSHARHLQYSQSCARVR